VPETEADRKSENLKRELEGIKLTEPGLTGKHLNPGKLQQSVSILKLPIIDQV
jgi:hypothetical protein